MRFANSYYLLLIYFNLIASGTINAQANKQKKSFELDYIFAGMGSNSHSIFPAFHVQKGMYYLTKEQDGFMGNTEIRIKPDTILLGIFRESSKDSIIQIISKIKESKIRKSNPGIMSGGVHYITISSISKAIEFELDNASDSNAEKIIAVLNSYISNKENKLWLFKHL